MDKNQMLDMLLLLANTIHREYSLSVSTIISIINETFTPDGVS